MDILSFCPCRMKISLPFEQSFVTLVSFFTPPKHVLPGISLYPLDPLYVPVGSSHAPAGIGSGPCGMHWSPSKIKLKSLRGVPCQNMLHVRSCFEQKKVPFIIFSLAFTIIFMFHRICKFISHKAICLWLFTLIPLLVNGTAERDV